jgi:hypothetical protein
VGFTVLGGGSPTHLMGGRQPLQPVVLFVLRQVRREKIGEGFFKPIMSTLSAEVSLSPKRKRVFFLVRKRSDSC